MKLVKNSQGVKPLHHKGFNVRLRLVTRTLGFRHLTKAATIAERSGKINWAIHFVDGSVVRAHQHAAGARRGELDPNNNLSAIAPWRRLPSSRHHQK